MKLFSLFAAGLLVWLHAFGQKHGEEVVFHQLIEMNYGLEIREWKGEAEQQLRTIAREVASRFNALDHQDDRMNEVGLAVETILAEGFREQGISCDVPGTRSGRKQKSGYPDLIFQYEQEVYYLEVKTFSANTRNSSQRTFYFTVSEDPKITVEAYHLLIGFEMEKQDDAHYRISGYHLLDLRNLPCKVKVEYNASNKDLYGEEDMGFRVSETITVE